MISQDLEQPVWPLNLAIVGGGKPSIFFLELSQKNLFPNLNIRFVAVCDQDHDAVGMKLARKMGIYTTTRFQDLFTLPDITINGIVELTNDPEVLMELIRLRPKEIGIIEHNLGWFIRQFHHMNEALRTSQNKVVLEKMSSDFLIQQSNAAVVMLNTDYTIVEANDAYLKAVGRKKEDVVGAHCYEVSHGLTSPCSDLHADISCPMAETLRTGKSAHVIHEHPTGLNHPQFCNLVTYPLKGKDGQILRIIEIWRDITEQLSFSWEKRLAALKDDTKRVIQEDRMISLGKLVASCVHEINNPIQGLLTFSHLMHDILEEKAPDRKDLDQFRHYLALMISELERCGNIVSGLLSFSRTPASSHQAVDLNGIMDQVIELTRHKMVLSNVELTVSRPDTPLIIRGDVNQLQQCFLNLVFNAIEAMPAGGVLCITAEKAAPEKKILIKVRDSGTGIDPKDLDAVFDPFFTTKPPGEGTGLGLSIVHGVVREHGGDVTVNSQPGKGTLFCLAFPVEIPERG